MTIQKPPLSDFFAYHEALALGQFDAVAQDLINRLTVNKPVVKGDGLVYFSQIVPALLEFDWYTEVGAMLWGNLFTVEPWSVRTIWDALHKYPDLLIIGAGSLGKSYSIGAYGVLDWVRDPLQTCFKVVSLTREHARRNAFANMRNLHEASVIPLPGERTASSIQVGDNSKQGIHLEALRQGEDGQGKLRGFHPDPRSTPHKIFTKTRIRAILDEAEELPPGVWSDVDNLLTSKFDSHHVKITAATNPRNRNSKMGQRVEPENGWDSIDMAGSEYWKSRLGWNVLHLNGSNCENVKQRRVVYPGLLTYEGFMRYVAMGEHSPDYWTMALGLYPLQGLSMNIIPPEFLTKSTGIFQFRGGTTSCAAFDLAFEGGDAVVATIGRFGEVTGWTNKDGQFIAFPKPRFGLQIEAQFEMPKALSLEQAQAIMSLCKTMRVTPKWLIVDRTGNGTGVHDNLRTLFGSEVMGLHYGTAATDSRVFIEDSKPAHELYDGVVSELFFAVRGMMEYDFIKLSPSLPFDKLIPQLTDRHYRRRGGRSRVEPKEEFTPRHGASPDNADSLTLLVHLVRMRAEVIFQMTPPQADRKPEPVRVGAVDTLKFIDTGAD